LHELREGLEFRKAVHYLLAGDTDCGAFGSPVLMCSSTWPLRFGCAPLQCFKPSNRAAVISFRFGDHSLEVCGGARLSSAPQP
jgi:hypothetical protein